MPDIFFEKVLGAFVHHSIKKKLSANRRERFSKEFDFFIYFYLFFLQYHRPGHDYIIHPETRPMIGTFGGAWDHLIITVVTRFMLVRGGNNLTIQTIGKQLTPKLVSKH